MDITELIHPQCALTNVEAGSKKHAIEILSKLIVGCDDSLSTDDVFTHLIERERLGCTALGNGAAMPHTRLADASVPVAACICLAKPVEFDTPDDQPVDLIFALVVPQDPDSEDVRDFESIMARLSDSDFQSELRAADSSSALYEKLVSVPYGDPGVAASAGA